MSKKALTVLLALMLAITCCLGFGCFSDDPESESESKIESVGQSESEIESESKVESEIESEIESESETESESESEVEPEMVEITFTAGEGYTYTVEDCEVVIGSTVEFSVTLGADYDESVIVVRANGEEITATEGVYSVVANADVVITVEGVQKDRVAITLTAGEGYTYSIEDCEVEIGSTVEFSVTLGADYDESVIVVKANGEEITANEGIYSVIANADVVITVEGVQKDRVAITLTAGEGYTYSIENCEVEIGSTVEFSVTLGADYDESEITVKANGEVLTAVEGTYSFVANANTEITVEGVEKDRVSITLTAGEGYTYSIEDCEVVIGTTVEFEVTLEDKYNESDIVVKANGEEVALVDGKYTVVASEDIEITVEGVERNQVVITEIFAGYDGTEGSIVNTAGKYEHSTLVAGHAKVYSSTLPLAYVTLAKYTLVRFAIYAESGTWFEIGTSGNLEFAGNAASWYEVKLVRETDKYQLYFNGDWKNFNLPLDANLNEMCMKLASSGNFYLTEVRGVEDENYVAPDGYAHGEILVADAPVGFSGTADENVNLLGGYKKNTAIAGSNTTYGGKALVDVDMDRYLQVRFSICAVDSGKYVEMGLVANGNFSSHAFSRSKWTWDEFKLVRDGDVVRIYKNGNIIDDFTIPANGNLSDIQIKFASSGTFYVSEVLAVADPNYVEKADVTFIGGEGYTYSIEDCRVEVGTSVEFSVILAENYNQSAIVVKANGVEVDAVDGKYTVVVNEDTEITVESVEKNKALIADVIVGFNGTESDFINTDGGYKKSFAIPGSNTTYTGKTLISVDLAKYTEIRFSVYCEGGKYLEMGTVESGGFSGVSCAYQSWTEFVFVREGDSFVTYRNGDKKSLTFPANGNLNDVQIRLATSGTFYFSEVYGIEDPSYVAPEYADGYSRVANVIVGFNGTESDFVNTDGGYKYSTAIPGTNTTYGGMILVDLDLSQYTEIRFSVYCEGGKYLEMGTVESGGFSGVSCHAEGWTEFLFVKEGDSFVTYRDGVKKSLTFPANGNLSDVQIRLATSGTFYFSEVLAK